MPPRAKIQEELSLAYIHAVSARAGCIFHAPPDFGVDRWIGFLTSMGGERRDLGHHVGVQAKATMRADVSRTHVTYDLDAKNYRDLALPEGLPRILVLFVMPPDEAEWLKLTDDELVLRRCAYWMHLRGRPPTTNREKVRVSIPRANRFDVDALSGPLKRLATDRRLS
jgi:hypothetical protein